MFCLSLSSTVESTTSVKYNNTITVESIIEELLRMEVIILTKVITI